MFQDSKEDKPPVTTAFVGNISERAPDAMVRQMLQVSMLHVFCSDNLDEIFSLIIDKTIKSCEN